MKYPFLLFAAAMLLVCLTNSLFADDNPGLGTLDQATEARLEAQTALDLGKVIALCQKARKEGLSGDNLKYCDQLMVSCQLQRGMYFAPILLVSPEKRPNDWKSVREKALADLEDAVKVISDQTKPYLLIAQLNLLPDGDTNRAKEALDTAQRNAKNEPALLLQIVSLKTALETDPVKREQILADAVSQNSNSQLTLLHALTLFDLKKNDEAVKLLKKILEDEDGNPEILTRTLKILTEHKEYDSALKLLTQLEKKTDGSQKLQFALQRAELLADLKRFGEALPILNELRKEYPGDIRILMLRSDVYLETKDSENALKDTEAALRMQQNHPLLLLQKVKIFLTQERHEDALAVVKEQRALNPKSEEYLGIEIEILVKLKRYDEAVEIITEQQRSEPDNERWTSLLIAVYLEQKAYDKALKIVEEQQAKKPEDEKWSKKKILIYAMQKKYTDAVRIIDGFIKKEPAKNDWYILKASLLAEQEKYQEAVDILDAFLKQYPDDKEVELIAVTILMDAKKNRKALERLKPLLEKEPENLKLLQVHSQTAIALGLHDDAVKALESVVKSLPDDSLSLNNLSWLYSTSPIDSLRNGKRALELAEQAAKITQYKEAYILSTLAAAYAELNNFDKAKEWSQKSIDLLKAEEKEIDKSNEKAVKRNKELLESLQKELETYKQQRPYRELENDGEK